MIILDYHRRLNVMKRLLIRGMQDSQRKRCDERSKVGVIASGNREI